MTPKHKLTIVILIILGIGLFYVSISFQNAIYDSITVLEKFIRGHLVLGALMFIVLSAFSAMLSPFSSVPLVPPAILVWGKLLTMLFLLTGWILGGIAGYAVGLYFGYPVVIKIINKYKVDRWVAEVPEKIGFWLIILFRLISPSEIGYVFGIIRYSFLKYAVATAISEAPYAIAIVYVSDAFLNENPKLFLFIGGVWVVVFFYMIHLFRKRYNQLKNKSHV